MKKWSIRLTIIALCSYLVISCSLSAVDDSGSSISVQYQGAGSKWAIGFSDSSFILYHYASATDTTPDMTVNGSYVEYANGFRKLTVTSATGTGAPSAGDTAYGFEVPGFAFFLQPTGADSEMIVMVEAGTCPTTSFTPNWITASFDDGQILDATSDTFGTADFDMTTPAASTVEITKYEPVGGTLLGTNPPVSFDHTTCSNGLLSFEPVAGETVDMFFTSSGGALVHSYDGATHDSIIFAAPAHSAPVVASDLDGTFSGLVFDDEGSAGDKVFPVKIVFSGGSATADRLTAVETDTTSGTPKALTTFAAHGAANGLFTMTIDNTAEADGRLSCTYTVVSTTKIIACNGFGSADNDTPFFMLGKMR